MYLGIVYRFDVDWSFIAAQICELNNIFLGLQTRGVLGMGLKDVGIGIEWKMMSGNKEWLQ